MMNYIDVFIIETIVCFLKEQGEYRDCIGYCLEYITIDLLFVTA